MQSFKGYVELLSAIDSRTHDVIDYKNGIGTAMTGTVNEDNSLVLDWAGGANSVPPSSYYVCEGLLEQECDSSGEVEIKTKRRYLPEGLYLVMVTSSGMVCVVDRLVKANQV